MNEPWVSDLMRTVPREVAELARTVIAEADALGMCVYLVGGPVRDLLLGRAIRDLDLLVEVLDGDDAGTLAKRAASGEDRVTCHDRFGTVTLARGAVAIDLATARKEAYAHDGALPTVCEGTLVDDLRRRDFTVNALALPLSREARSRYPGIVDLERGLDDLANRRLRVLHERSFHDDPTRALRAARLSARLGFALSRGSRSGLQDALRDGSFGRVSGERLRRELIKLFEDVRLGEDLVRALQLLDEWHVLGALEPGLTLPAAARPPLRRVRRSMERAPWPAQRWRAWVTGLGIWLAPFGPQLRRRVARRFAIRGALCERIVDMGALTERTLRALATARGRAAVDALLRDLQEEELHAIHASAAPAVRRRVVRFAREDRQRRPPISGADLTAIGISGPQVGRALDRIRAAFLDGGVRTRDEALALAREMQRQGAGATARRARGKARPPSDRSTAAKPPRER